jgi:hypothetical protein
MELWTLGELAERVEAALADYPGQANGRVRAVPDQRTIRWYTTTGLVDRPTEMRGRTALYGRRHLLQLVAIKRRQAQGRTIAQIQSELAGATNQSLEPIASLPNPFPPSPPLTPPTPRDAGRVSGVGDAQPEPGGVSGVGGAQPEPGGAGGVSGAQPKSGRAGGVSGAQPEPGRAGGLSGGGDAVPAPGGTPGTAGGSSPATGVAEDAIPEPGESSLAGGTALPRARFWADRSAELSPTEAAPSTASRPTAASGGVPAGELLSAESSEAEADFREAPRPASAAVAEQGVLAADGGPGGTPRLASASVRGLLSATSGAITAEVAVVTAVRIADGVTVVLDQVGAVPDAERLAAAAGPFLAELRRQGLLTQSSGDES